MKPVSFILIFLLSYSLSAQNEIKRSDTLLVDNGFKHLYRYQNFYLGGQPTLEALRWFKKQGVTQIINLRSHKENEEYSR